MVFVACGLNHTTAPLSLREKLVLPLDLQRNLLHKLLQQPGVQDAVILSTCNRTEIYCDMENPDLLPAWIATAYEMTAASLVPFLYTYRAEQGLQHMLRVASGLDSMMLGEPQILGQMKQAYHQACAWGTVKIPLRTVFDYVFTACKRIRTVSGVGNNPISVAYAAVQLIGQSFAQLDALHVLLIGSGEMSSLVAKYLYQHGVKKFSIASRTPDNAQKLADTLNGDTLSITNLSQHLPKADVVISATACPLPFINTDLVTQALAQRQHAPMFILDLAVPRDVEPEVKHMAHVQLYDIDDLQHRVDKGLDKRRLAAVHANQLVEEAVALFSQWHRAIQAKHKAKGVICDYRNLMQQLAEQEVQKALKQLKAGQCQQTVVQALSQRLVNKLTHSPTLGLKQIAWEDREDLLTLAQYLFNTDQHIGVYEEIA